MATTTLLGLAIGIHPFASCKQAASDMELQSLLYDSLIFFGDAGFPPWALDHLVGSCGIYRLHVGSRSSSGRHFLNVFCR